MGDVDVLQVNLGEEISCSSSTSIVPENFEHVSPRCEMWDDSIRNQMECEMELLGSNFVVLAADLGGAIGPSRTCLQQKFSSVGSEDCCVVSKGESYQGLLSPVYIDGNASLELVSKLEDISHLQYSGQVICIPLPVHQEKGRLDSEELKENINERDWRKLKVKPDGSEENHGDAKDDLTIPCGEMRFTSCCQNVVNKTTCLTCEHNTSEKDVDKHTSLVGSYEFTTDEAEKTCLLLHSQGFLLNHPEGRRIKEAESSLLASESSNHINECAVENNEIAPFVRICGSVVNVNEFNIENNQVEHRVPVMIDKNEHYTDGEGEDQEAKDFRASTEEHRENVIVQAQVIKIDLSPVAAVVQREVCEVSHVLGPEGGSVDSRQFHEVDTSYTGEPYVGCKELITNADVCDEYQTMISYSLDTSKRDLSKLEDGITFHANKHDLSRVEDDHFDQVDEHGNIVHDFERNGQASESHNMAFVGSIIKDNCLPKAFERELFAVFGIENDLVVQCLPNTCNRSDSPVTEMKPNRGTAQENVFDGFSSANERFGCEIHVIANGESTGLFSGMLQGQAEITNPSRSGAELCVTDIGVCSLDSNLPMTLSDEINSENADTHADIHNIKEFGSEVSEEINFLANSLSNDDQTEDGSGDTSEDTNTDLRPVWISIAGFDHLSSDVSYAVSAGTKELKTSLMSNVKAEISLHQHVVAAAAVVKDHMERAEKGQVDSFQIVVTCRGGELGLPLPLLQTFEREVRALYSKYSCVGQVLFSSTGYESSENKTFDPLRACKKGTELVAVSADLRENGIKESLHLGSLRKQSYSSSNHDEISEKSSSSLRPVTVFEKNGCERPPSTEGKEEQDSTGIVVLPEVCTDLNFICNNEPSMKYAPNEEDRLDIEKVKLGHLSDPPSKISENTKITLHSLSPQLKIEMKSEESHIEHSYVPSLTNSATPDFELHRKVSTGKNLTTECECWQHNDVRSSTELNVRSRTVLASCDRSEELNIRSSTVLNDCDGSVDLNKDFEESFHHAVPAHEESVSDLIPTDTWDNQTFRSVASSAHPRHKRAKRRNKRFKQHAHGCMSCLKVKGEVHKAACSNGLTSQDKIAALFSCVNTGILSQEVTARNGRRGADSGILRCEGIVSVSEEDGVEIPCTRLHMNRLFLIARHQETDSHVIFQNTADNVMQVSELSFETTFFWICLAVAILIYNFSNWVR